MAKRRPTKAEREYMDLVASLGCIICRRPPELHHPRCLAGMGQRSSHMDVIPLCFDHHRGSTMSAHGRDRKEFFDTYGTELELLDQTKELVELRRDSDEYAAG
jgi:hypothetical protein